MLVVFGLTEINSGKSPLAGPTQASLLGKVYVKATDKNNKIHRGDYLVSSDILGTAMKGTDYGRMTAPFVVIGIAMSEVKDGYVLCIIKQ